MREFFHNNKVARQHIIRYILLSSRLSFLKCLATFYKQHNLLIFLVKHRTSTFNSANTHCGIFDFAKLNSVTFYLNLIIHSSQVDNEAFIINICQIACTINSFLVIRINGILNKCLLRNFDYSNIKRYACTYNAYFALFVRLCNFYSSR